MRTNTKGVLVSNEAITVGRKTVRWEQIAEIRKGRLPIAGVSLHNRSERGLMGFPAHPIVLREILPIICKRGKDLTVHRNHESVCEGFYLIFKLGFDETHQ